eukprot:7391472-Prymnesium_polylepis.3
MAGHARYLCDCVLRANAGWNRTWMCVSTIVRDARHSHGTGLSLRRQGIRSILAYTCRCTCATCSLVVKRSRVLGSCSWPDHLSTTVCVRSPPEPSSSSLNLESLRRQGTACKTK